MPLTSFGDGIWFDSDPVSILGMPFTATMAVLRLNDGSVLLYSPVAMTAERRAAIEAVGPVTHLYAPNLFHHRWVGDWADAFPAARVHAPAGLAKKHAGLRVDRVHGESPEPAFEGLIDEQPIRGFRLRESALVYRPARALLVADLIQNVGRPEQTSSKLYAQAMGFYDRIALSRMLCWTAFSDRAEARRSIDDLLALPFERIVVGHGSPVAAGGKEALTDAFAWLPRASG